MLFTIALTVIVGLTKKIESIISKFISQCFHKSIKIFFITKSIFIKRNLKTFQFKFTKKPFITEITWRAEYNLRKITFITSTNNYSTSTH